jgi:hypothetical protein
MEPGIFCTSAKFFALSGAAAARQTRRAGNQRWSCPAHDAAHWPPSCLKSYRVIRILEERAMRIRKRVVPAMAILTVLVVPFGVLTFLYAVATIGVILSVGSMVYSVRCAQRRRASGANEPGRAVMGNRDRASVVHSPWACRWGRPLSGEADVVRHPYESLWTCRHPEAGLKVRVLRADECDTCERWEPTRVVTRA